MLSAKKLAHRQIAYYLSYAARGAQGFWVGRGAAELGLTGGVDPADFIDLAEGRAPGGKPLLGRVPKDRTPGWDFTFSAPKSVSLCFALAGQELRQTILDAHHQAARAAIGFLEDAGGRARRGLGGRDGHVGAGLAVACFTHPSSRELDPQLHVHGLVLNVANGQDGRWTALDSRMLYLHKRAAGSIYRAELRARLAEMGARWGNPDRRGLQEMVDVDTSALRSFSTRRAQIEARLAPGASSAAAQVACIATRRAKVDVELEVLSERWAVQAAAVGWNRTRVEEVLDGDDRSGVVDDRHREAVERALLAPGGLTKEAAAFTRDDTLVAWSRLLVQGVHRAELESLADHTLVRPEIVPLVVADEDGRALSTDNRGKSRSVLRLVRRPSATNGTLMCEERYSTTELLSVESELLETATGSRCASAGIVATELVESILEARPHLSTEQRAMVRRACGSGDLVEVVVGVPGSGKTFALEAAKGAWCSAGYRVLGAAFSAAAATQLQAGSGIKSETFDSLRCRLARGAEHLDPQTVIVVDEAGMLDTRRTAQLVSWAKGSGAKVVLTGDDRQLPAVETGGAFASLARRLGGARLESNARQVAGWERRALQALRDGRTGEAAGEYLRHGRVRVFSSPHELLGDMVAGWWEARAAGAQAALYAYSRDAAWVLNTMARACLAHEGMLSGEELVVPEHSPLDLAERRYQVGDELCCLKNRGRLGAGRDPSGLGVRNGTRGLVEEVDVEHGEVALSTDDGRHLRLPADYVVRHTDYGYAWTLHKGQGQTVGQARAAGSAKGRTEGRAFVYGADALSAEAALVAASRATDGTELFVLVDPEQERDEPLDVSAALAKAWARSQGEALASEELEIRRKIAEAAEADVDELAERRRVLAQAIGLGPLVDSAALEQSRRRELGGAVVALEDLEEERARASAALVLAETAEERRGAKEVLRRLGPERRELQAEAELALSGLVTVEEAVSAQGAARAAEGGDLRAVGFRLEVLDSALATRRQRWLDGLCADPPAYLVRLLGAPPVDDVRRQLRWRQGVTDVEDYRRSVGLGGTAGAGGPGSSLWTEALGPEPEGFEGRRYRRVVEAVAAVRRDIDVEGAKFAVAAAGGSGGRHAAPATGRVSKFDRRRRRPPPRPDRGMAR